MKEIRWEDPIGVKLEEKNLQTKQEDMKQWVKTFQICYDFAIQDYYRLPHLAKFFNELLLGVSSTMF